MQGLEEKLVELKEVKKEGDVQKQEVQGPDEFQLVEDADVLKEETDNPTKYYQFAVKEDTNKYIKMLFEWMQDTEITMRQAAGMKFGIIAAIIFGIIGALKVEYFYKISFMNYLFLQGLVSLAVFYFICRSFDILPFIEDETLNNRLKFGAGAILVGIVFYISSWNYWPRQYSHFLLCCIPLIENLREGLRTETFKGMDFLLLFVNLIGFLILLAIPDRDISFSAQGLIYSMVGVVLFWIAFQQLKQLGSNNVVSISLVNTLVLSIFLPGFFGIVDAETPTFAELMMIIVLGIPASIATILMIRCVQITKPSHSLLAASVSLAIISWVRSVNLEGFGIQGVLGVVLAVGCAVIILYQQQDKTAIMEYMKKDSVARPAN